MSKIQVFEGLRGSIWIDEEEWLYFRNAVYILLTGKKPGIMPMPLTVQFVWGFLRVFLFGWGF